MCMVISFGHTAIDKVERLMASPIWRPAVFHMASLGLACASLWDAMWKTA